ncbi:DUF6794 domain-containing protein [Labilibacter marinus]|uniref:DUF6794 domain-containing protein n=1 Tax=Labilibacter marinus TaxID=1477105 RepID=UPI00082B8D8F|nr:DUF6794 domain-containing protein [Labilibacter marinus]
MTAKLIIILTIFSTSIFAQVDCEKYSDKYIPIDLNDALNFLDCKWSKSDKDSFKTKPENDAVTEMHFGTGMGIRNSWGLWKGNSGISKYFRDLGINHPDDMSGIILTSFHRHLNDTDIKLDEQVKFYTDYWEKSKQAEINRKRKKFNEFSVNDSVDFLYNYDYVSKDQEDKDMDDICIAKGFVISKDTIDLRLQVRLLESCDEKGIIISKSDIYIQEGTEWILKEKDKIEIMKIGETKWTNYDIWETIE